MPPAADQSSVERVHRTNVLITRRKMAKGWGPDRRRSGPHQMANFGNTISELLLISGGA